VCILYVLKFVYQIVEAVALTSTDVYCEVSLDGQQPRKTDIVSNTTRPSFTKKRMGSIFRRKESKNIISIRKEKTQNLKSETFKT